MHILEDQIEIKHAKQFFQIKTKYLNIKSSHIIIEMLELQWEAGLVHNRTLSKGIH